MIYRVDLLIKDQKLFTASETETVRDALVTMIDNDFSQLPIIDDQGGLAGIISEKTIARVSYHIANSVDVLSLKVTECSEPPSTLPRASDIFDALELLRDRDAIVVVEGSQPVGIVTNADAVTFFRELAEGIVLVEDIETSLRSYVGEAFPTEQALSEALQNAFKHRQKGEDAEELLPDRLTFGDYVNLITNGRNWPLLEKQLEPKELFRTYMEQVRDIRNQLMHFRGHLDAVQYDALRRARDWIEGRRRRSLRLSMTTVTGTFEVTLEPIILHAEGTVSSADEQTKYPIGKYDPLQLWLENTSATARANQIINLEFSKVEEIIGATLPPSARQHRAWWANDSTSSRQALAWMKAGWAVQNVDFGSEVVTLKRTDTVLYQLMWSDLAERLKAVRPGLSRTSKSYSQNWCSFSAGKSGLSYAWSFSRDRSELWTQLFIDTRSTDSRAAKRYFDQLERQKSDIERDFGSSLTWDNKSLEYAVRIYATHPARITSAPEELEELKQWAITAMQRLADATQSRLAELY